MVTPPLVRADSCGLVVHALRLLLFEPPGNFPAWSRFVWIRVDSWFALFFPWSAIQSPSVVKQREPFLHHFLHFTNCKCLICNGPVGGIAPLKRDAHFAGHFVEDVLGQAPEGALGRAGMSDERAAMGAYGRLRP